ncbi:hypothetical protein BaRGS_00038458 [Batillaria attramentaria]|uniref:RING-type domain-containing protein n=2 Tax=Batillaria attramentaria TaxID=370345 RepID=A0ABD0J5P8_9CAEN
MASHTTQRLQQDFLSCPRCSNTFKDPKALPCLHNFCKPCLQLYIDEQMDGGRHTAFSCPICHKKIFVPDPSKPTSLWANQFPSNFVMKGMLDAITLGSPEPPAPGDGGRDRNPLGRAGSLDRPRGSPDSPSARRDRLGRMGQSGDSTRGSGATAGGGAGAGQGAQDLESNPEAREVLSKIQELRTSLQREESGIMASLTNLTRQRDDQERSMSDTVAKLQEVIAMRKTELVEELSKCFSDEVEKLRQRVQSCRDHLQSLRSCEELLQSQSSLLTSGYGGSELLESVNLQLEEVQYRPRPENPARVVLQYDAASVYNVTEALASFGSVLVEKEPASGRPPLATQGDARGHSASQSATQGHPTPSAPDPQGELPSYSAVARVPGAVTPQLIERISPGQLVRDGTGQQIYDITVLAGGVLVMTVYGEKCVQAFRSLRLQSGVKTRSLLGRVQLDTEPRCVCALGKGYVAVAGDMCLYLVAVLNDRLELKRTIPTGKSYTGIAAYGDSTLVNPVGVDFVGLNGFINETIDRDRATGQLLFRAPSFLATSSKDGLLFVSDSTRLLCVNNAGKVKYEYPKPDADCLSSSQGVCCDPAGFVYLVDRGKRRVMALSSRGTRIADVLTDEHGITDPCAIAVDENGLVYVTNDFVDVLVFRVC